MLKLKGYKRKGISVIEDIMLNDLIAKCPKPESRLTLTYISMNKEILKKAAGFCAYQERTHREVKERLDEWGVWGDEADEIVVWLIENNYLNEERFAKIFAGSKFRVKKWGRLKIRQELKMRGVSDYCLKMGMKEIDPDEYIQTLEDVLHKKRGEIKDNNPLVVKQKLLRYALSKGYEQDLIWDALGRIVY